MKLDKFADFPLKQFESNCENNEKYLDICQKMEKSWENPGI